MIAIWMRKGLIWKWNKWDLSLALPYLHHWETFVKRLENKHLQQESEFLWKKYVYCRSLMKIRFSTALMTWYHQVSTITALYWSGTTKYQQVLTQYHHISTSATPYWPSTTKYQPVPTYTVVAWGLQTSAQFTLGLVQYRAFFAFYCSLQQHR